LFDPPTHFKAMSREHKPSFIVRQLHSLSLRRAQHFEKDSARKEQIKYAALKYSDTASLLTDLSLNPWGVLRDQVCSHSAGKIKQSDNEAVQVFRLRYGVSKYRGSVEAWGE
jgi:hypothetical protein